MRTILYFALIILVTTDYVAAQPMARPTTQPQSVLVLPFAPPAGDDYQWAGQSIQQVLAADLTHGSTLKVIAPAGAKAASDADSALKSRRRRRRGHRRFRPDSTARQRDPSDR